MLPELDTVCFDADLPLAVHPLAAFSTKLARETRLALRVLAAPTGTADNADPMLQRLEAKLDLALEVALFARHPDSGALTPCRLGLRQLAWYWPQPLAPAEHVMLSLSPHADSALTLFLPARIARCQALADGGQLLLASLAPALDEHSEPLWEKWVFRRHREAIGQRGR